MLTKRWRSAISLILMTAMIWGITGFRAVEAASTTITIDGNLSDWDSVTTCLGDKAGDVNGGGDYDFVKFCVTNDTNNVYIRWDLHLGTAALGQTAFAAGFTHQIANGTRPSNQHLAWVHHDQGNITVEIRNTNGTIATVQALAPAGSGTYARTAYIGSTDRVVVVEAAFPFSKFAEAGITQVTNALATMPIWAEGHASQQSSSAVKDYVPDFGYLDCNMAGTCVPNGTGPVAQVSGSTSTASVPQGGTVTYELEVMNVGDATGGGNLSVTQLNWTLPSGFTYVTGSSSGITTSNPTGTTGTLSWTGLSLSLAPGAWHTLTFQATVGGAVAANTYYSQVNAGHNVLTRVSPSAQYGTTTTQTGDTAPVTVTVAPANTAPTISDTGNQTIAEDTSTGALAFTVGDAQTAAGGLTVTATSSNQTLVPNANITLGGSDANRTVTVTPAANQNGGPVTITLTVSDGSLSATDTFTVSVTPVNDSPTISDIANQTIPEDTPTGALAFTIGDIETAADSLTVTATSNNQTLVPNGNITLGGSGTNRTVTVTPNPEKNGGPATITVTVSDGALSASDTFTVTVTPVDDTPTISNIANQTIAEDTATGALAFTVDDIETAAGSLTVTATSSNQTLVPDANIALGGSGANRTVTVTPAANENGGPVTITVNVSDGNTSSSDTFTVTVTPVNDGPTISNITNRTIPENGSTGALSFTVADIETAAGSLTVTATSDNQTLVPDANITLGGADGNRTVTVTPAAGQNGLAAITVTVSDGSLTATDTFDVTVTVGNTAPTISDIGNQTIAEDTATGALAFTVADAQTAAGGLTVTATSSDQTLVPDGNISFGGSDGSRTVTVTPAANRSGGPVTITVTVSDGALSATDTFTVTVTPVNDNPQAAADSATVAEDSAATVIDVLANDGISPDTGETLTVTAVTQPANGTVTLVGGVVRFTPAANFNGATSFTYTVSDGNGGTATATVTMTVTSVNDNPQAGADSFTVAENSGAAAVDVLANDSISPDTGETLTITAVTQPANGTVVITGGGTGLTFEPAGDFSGSTSFTYTVSDGNGGTATATVSMTVSNVNQNPTANADPATVAEDSAATVIDVLANDSTAPDVGETLTVTAVTQPANGTVTLVGGVVRFTPAANFNGSTSFTYTVSDGNGGTATATVTMTVTSVNDNPQAGADAFTVAENSGAAAVDVLANDSISPDTGETLTITAVTQPANGTVVITGGGTGLTFEPAGDFSGSTSFTYTVSDGNGGTATATVSMTVSNVNQNPTANDDSPTVAEDSGATALDVLANDTAAPDVGETLTITSVVQPPSGTVAITGGGTGLTFAPPANFSGSIGFTYTISDGNGGTDTANVSVTVTSVNDNPQANADSATVAEDSSAAAVDVLANDSISPDTGETLTITAVTQPANGTVVITGGGTGLTFQPAGNFVGATSFTYTVSDGNGGTATATVTMTVSNTNDAPDLGAIGNKSVNEGTELSFTATAADSDLPAQTLTFALTEAPAGAVINETTGVFQWTPAETQDGTHTVTIQVSDGTATDSETITVTVTEVNTAPVLALLADQQVDERAALTFTAAATDSDRVLGVANTLAYSLVGNPAGMTVNAATGAVSWTAPEGTTNQTFTFTVRVSDDAAPAATDDQSLTVTVREVNRIPQWSPAAGNTAQTIPEGGVPAALAATDADGDPLTYAVVGGTLPPGISLNANGTFTGTASYDASGTYTITVRVSDGRGGTAVTTLTLTVTNVNRMPAFTSTPGGQTIKSGEGITGLSALDPDNDPLTYSVVGGSLPPGITLNGGGSFSGTASDQAAGPYTVTVQVSDGKGGTATTTITIMVTPQAGSVYGTVYSATGGKVAGITVLIQKPDGTSKAVTADSEGLFRFSGLGAGAYVLYAPGPNDPLATRNVTLDTGNTSAQADLTLAARGTLTLSANPSTVIGDGISTSTLTASLKFNSGAPVSGVGLQFSTTAGRLSTGSSTTGADGQAAAVLTAPVIEGTATRTETAEVIVRDATNGLYAEARISITFTPAAIVGIVVDSATGKPVEGARVEVAEDFNGDGVIDFAASVTTGPDGRYQITVPRGNWTYRSKITATVERNGRMVTLVSENAGPVGALQGTGEKIPAARAIGGAVLIVGSNDQGPAQAGEVLGQGATISATIRTPSRTPVDAKVEVKPDGSYNVEGLAPGQYELLFQVTAPNGQKLAGTMIKVTIDQDGEMALDTGLIDPYGIVTDAATGKPISGVKMTLFWADTPLNRAKNRVPHTPVSLPLLAGFQPNQNADPQMTTVDGAYAWMVYPDADYYIVAEHEGYHRYDSRAEARSVPAAVGEDSYVTRGIIHVGETIVQYNLSLTPTTQPAPPAVPGGTPQTPAPGGPVTPADPGTPAGPVRDSHVRYILGYPDGQFKPENSITRAEVATVLARIVRGTLVIPAGSTPLPFKDVSAAHWASGYIGAVMQDGLMMGDPDGRFRPDEPISRAEVATIAVRFKGLRSATEKAFSDVSGHWAEQYVNTAHRARLVTGYPDGTFLPQKRTSRAEFVTIMNRMLGRGPLTGLAAATWSDVPATHWAWGQVEEASSNHESERLQDESERWIRNK